MAFKLAEAFIEFTARTQPAIQGMEQVEQRAAKTAESMATSLGGASVAAASLTGALVTVGTIAATRFASGIAEGIQQGGSFSEVLEAGKSSLLGVESGLKKAADAQKELNAARERGMAISNRLNSAQTKLDADENPQPSELAGFGKTAPKLAADLEELRKIKNAAIKEARDARQQIADAEKYAAIAGKTFVGQGGLNAQTQLNDLANRNPNLAGMGATEAKAAADHLKTINHALLDAATAAEMAFNREEKRLSDLSAQMQFSQRVIDSLKGSYVELKGAIAPVFGAIGEGIKGWDAMDKVVQRAQGNLDQLKRRQADRADDDAGLRAIDARFKPQIDALERSQKSPQFTTLEGMSQMAQRAAGGDNKAQIDVLKEQLAEAKKTFENEQAIKHLQQEAVDNLKKIAGKAFGWAQ